MSAPVAKVDIPYINRYRDRHGRERFYYRRKGCKPVPLPHPSSPAFSAAYERAHGGPLIHPTGKGTFGALVQEYLASPKFREKAEATRREYRRVLERMARDHGDKPVADLSRRHIILMRDARAETPGAANTFVRYLKLLMTFAVEREYRTDNPALGIAQFRLGEWRAWTGVERDAFAARWPVGTMQRRAFTLAIYTMQRRSDLIAMTQACRRGGYILVTQSKGGARLEIPEHPTLTAELAADPPEHMSLLTTSQGKAFDAIYFGAWFADAIAAAGLPEECVLHGLRKSGLSDLAEAGCTEEQIRAVSGHTSAAMVGRYTRAARQRKLADDAMANVVRMGK